MTETNRQAMAAKINSLLSKTVDNGATEEEAMAAMAKATELMTKYEFNMTQAQFESQGLDKVVIILGKNLVYNNAGWALAYWISKLTETKVWKQQQPGAIVFFGLKSDIAFAEWIYKTLCTWCSNEADHWWKSPLNYIPSSEITGAERAKLKVSFAAGATSRINKRMAEEIELRKTARRENNAGQTGNALVVIEDVKKRIIEEGFAKTGMRLNKSSSGRRNYVDVAHRAGYVAGDNASWGKPVNGGGATLRIK